MAEYTMKDLLAGVEEKHIGATSWLADTLKSSDLQPTKFGFDHFAVDRSVDARLLLRGSRRTILGAVHSVVIRDHSYEGSRPMVVKFEGEQGLPCTDDYHVAIGQTTIGLRFVEEDSLDEMAADPEDGSERMSDGLAMAWYVGGARSVEEQCQYLREGREASEEFKKSPEGKRLKEIRARIKKELGIED